MRTARIVEEGGGYYHVMSRIVDRRMVIDDSEKGILRNLMRGMEGVSGVEIVTYAILDNHFHILLYVPERQDVEDDELIRRLGCLYSKPVVKSAEKHLVLLREKGLDAEAEEFKLTYSYRMYDLAQYMRLYPDLPNAETPFSPAKPGCFCTFRVFVCCSGLAQRIRPVAQAIAGGRLDDAPHLRRAVQGPFSPRRGVQPPPSFVQVVRFS